MTLARSRPLEPRPQGSRPPLGLSPIQLEEEIDRLRSSMNAVILAHYYQDADIQDMADFIGDSLELSRKAAATDADVIVFCGVKFMAEVAKILSPTKQVLLPDMAAGCSLETSCPPDAFKAFRDQHPDHIALTYINCSAEIKALSDIIVTSSNAEHIINQIPADQPIIFAPDQHLGRYLSQKTGRDMLLWEGSCIVHERFSARELVKLQTRRPQAVTIAHPECPSDVLSHAQFVGSTSALLNYVTMSDYTDFIVATEPGILHQMQKAAPHKTFTPAPDMDGSCACNDCPYMKLNTMEKLYMCMANRSPEIIMAEDLRLGALDSLNKMMEMSPKATAPAYA